MYFKSKKVSLLILVVTAMVCSRTMFWFFDDPEGPNLLIVTVTAGLIYGISMMVYARHSFTKVLVPLTGLTRLLLAILVQIITASVFYFILINIPA